MNLRSEGVRFRRQFAAGVRLCTTGLLLLACSACGEKPASPNYPDPVPVTGVVTLDGKPLENATVTFVPTGKEMLSAVGDTDPSGEFELMTGVGPQAKPGAIPGSYKVWISSLVKPDGTRVAFDPKIPPADMMAHESLPPKYSDAGQSELTANVGSEGGEFKFELTSQ